MQYLETASRIGESSLSRADIQGWTTVLLDRVTSLLDAATSPGLRAGLLDAAAHLSLRFDAEAVDQLAPRAASTETPQHRAPDDLAEIEIPDWMPLIDIEHGMAALLELVSLLPQAPLFPIRA